VDNNTVYVTAVNAWDGEEIHIFESSDLEKLKEPTKSPVKFYNDLEAYGYDQVPTGSNHSYEQNMEATVDYCKKVIDPSRLYGFMTAP